MLQEMNTAKVLTKLEAFKQLKEATKLYKRLTISFVVPQNSGLPERFKPGAGLKVALNGEDLSKSFEFNQSSVKFQVVLDKESYLVTLSLSNLVAFSCITTTINKEFESIKAFGPELGLELVGVG